MFRTGVRRMSSTELREPVIALFSGSARKDSFNTKLAESAAQLLASSKYGAATKLLDLSSYELPLYDQDLEADGMPSGVMALKEDLSSADGWVYCSPEYNGSMTPLFVNAMTWASRGDPDGKMYATFQDKFAIVLSASPGAMGGMRSINPNRQLLMNLGVNVLPQSVAIGGAFKAFDESGNLKDKKHVSMLDKACGDLFFLTRNEANKSAACKIIETHLATVGAYGAVDVAE
jgi:NAD(P)H-dependent FMN reductase